MGTTYYDAIGLLAISDTIDSADAIKIPALITSQKAYNKRTQEFEARQAAALKKGPPYPIPTASPDAFKREESTKPVHGFLHHAPAGLGPHVAPPMRLNTGQPNLPGNVTKVVQRIEIPGQEAVNLPAHLLPRNLAPKGVLLGRGDYGSRLDFGSTNGGVAKPYGQYQQSPQNSPRPLVGASPSTPVSHSTPTAAVHHPGSAGGAAGTASPHAQVAPRQHNYRQSSQAGSPQFRREICPVCGRAFEGPKASTHKQQHIRRLHPQDYMPKRGGKKRMVRDPATGMLVPESPGTPQPQAPPGQGQVQMQVPVAASSPAPVPAPQAPDTPGSTTW